MARFFIDRPIFAWVIALVIMLAGSLAIIKLPVAQYPSIAPPAVGISASYPGASAKTVEDSVTQIIEQNMTGLDHLLYMSSQSDSAGRVSVTLTFQPGTDPDIAQVQVQNKLQDHRLHHHRSHRRHHREGLVGHRGLLVLVLREEGRSVPSWRAATAPKVSIPHSGRSTPLGGRTGHGDPNAQCA